MMLPYITSNLSFLYRCALDYRFAASFMMSTLARFETSGSCAVC